MLWKCLTRKTLLMFSLNYLSCFSLIVFDWICIHIIFGFPKNWYRFNFVLFWNFNFDENLLNIFEALISFWGWNLLRIFEYFFNPHSHIFCRYFCFRLPSRGELIVESLVGPCLSLFSLNFNSISLRHSWKAPKISSKFQLQTF